MRQGPDVHAGGRDTAYGVYVKPYVTLCVPSTSRFSNLLRPETLAIRFTMYSDRWVTFFNRVTGRFLTKADA